MDDNYPFQPRASARGSSIHAEPAITVLAVARYAWIARDPGAQAALADALEPTGRAVMGGILNSFQHQLETRTERLELVLEGVQDAAHHRAARGLERIGGILNSFQHQLEALRARLDRLQRALPADVPRCSVERVASFATVA